MTNYILLLSVVIPLTSEYSRPTLLQNPTAILTVVCGGAVCWGSLENFQLNHFCSNSVSLRWIQPPTKKIPEEFSLGWSAPGTRSWQICQPNSDRCQNKSECPTFHPLSETSWLVRETFTFTFVKIHVMNTQVAHREQVRIPIIQIISHNGSGVVETEQQKSRSHVVRFNSATVISYRCIETHADTLVQISPLYNNCPQYLGHTDSSRSGVKMFLRVVILVFAATCCTGRVIGKTLHTRH
jgi:hypothetical protein